MKTLAKLIMLSMVLFGAQAFAGEEPAAAGPSLFERLGAEEGISNIVDDTIAMHLENDEIKDIFVGVDLDKLAMHVKAFFAAGTGGPANYTGRDMTTTHADMGLTEADFDAAVGDVLNACKKNGVDEKSVAEVAAILESLRPAVMGTAAT